MSEASENTARKSTAKRWRIIPERQEELTQRQRELIEACNRVGSVRGAAKALGVCNSTIVTTLGRLSAKGVIEAVDALLAPTEFEEPTIKSRRERLSLTVRPLTRRFLLTAAQDETPVVEPFWKNLHAYARFIGAEVIVGGFTYQKGLFEDHAVRTGYFAEAVRPFLRHDRVTLSPDIVFCAEMNTLPTAVKPLSGLHTYTQGRWGVFPHAKVQLVSVPTHVSRHPAMLMTTGACTQKNYVAKKAGYVAAFHHVVGATIVEIDGDGLVFCRQICAADDGSFQDLDIRVKGGEVSRGNRIEALTNGDIHVEKIDSDVARCIWGLDTDKMVVDGSGLIDDLRPRFQFIHDLLDFTARNHHRKGDHLFRFTMHITGQAAIDGALRRASRFLRASQRDFCQTVCVPSNHNDAFPRWLREADPRQDEVNARLWFQANDALYAAVERADPAFDVFRWAVSRHDPDGLEYVAFPPRDASFLICQDSGGIENIYHGDKGPNGVRGTPEAMRAVAIRMNTAHTHSAGIIDGVYTAGLCGNLDQGYNFDSPSSWTHSQIITYPNSRRTIVTIRNGKYRAE